MRRVGLMLSFSVAWLAMAYVAVGSPSLDLTQVAAIVASPFVGSGWHWALERPRR